MSNNGSARSVCILTTFFIIVFTSFCTVTILQLMRARNLRLKFEASQMLLVQLKEECFQDGLGEAFNPVLTLHNSEPAEIITVHEQHRRVLQSSLQELLINITLKEQQALLTQCLNSSKLCMPGDTGDPGTKGYTGSPGRSGKQGPGGPPGEKGDMGPPGWNGTKGNIGPKGFRGDPGTSGLTGIQGLPGEPGSPGYNGTDGIKGDKGPRGNNGTKGDPGLKGPDGPPGVNGTKGAPGQAGDPGLRGDPGTTGPSGFDGQLEEHDCLCIKTPTIDLTEPTNPTIYELLGANVTLYCDTNVTNDTTVTWTVPDTATCTISSTSGPYLTIESLQIPQQGSYICNVSNQFGYDTRTFTVHVNRTDTGGLLSCDFEHADLCHWTADSSTLGKWITASGATDTSNTGPAFDHTPGQNHNGSYAYTDASLSFFKGDQSNLTSVLLPVSREPSCLYFWYNMNGATVGALNVYQVEYVKSTNGICTEKATLLKQITGNQGPNWHNTRIETIATNSTQRIVVQSVHGGGTKGDIAIDDLEYYTGACNPSLLVNGPLVQTIVATENSGFALNCTITGQPKPVIRWTKSAVCNSAKQTLTTISPILHVSDKATSIDAGEYQCSANRATKTVTQTFHVSVNSSISTEGTCTFDQGNLCGWRQDSRDDRDLAFQEGQTQTSDTGPLHDHGSGSGKYIYLETSAPVNQGESAILLSNSLPAHLPKCFSFFYNMYGDGMGTLNVTVEDLCTGNERTLFSISGDQGQDWKGYTLPIPASEMPHDYRIRFITVAGDSFHSDIALDDITLHYSNCLVPNINCNFTTNGSDCNWNQSKIDTMNWLRMSHSTPTDDTGPDGDHTDPSGNGYYMYTEVSSPNQQGDYADLVSPLFPGGMDYCLGMAVNMYGAGMGKIEIYKQKLSETSPSTLLQTFNHATSTPKWQEHQINIPVSPDEDFRLVIRGTIGADYTSDAAIDDLKIHAGQC